MCPKTGPGDDVKEQRGEFPGGEWREAISLKKAIFPARRRIITVRVLVRTANGKAADTTTPVEWKRFHGRKLTGSGTFMGSTDAVIHTGEIGLRIEVRPAKSVILVFEPIAPPEQKKASRKKTGLF